MSVGTDILAMTPLVLEIQEEASQPEVPAGSTDVQIREPGVGGSRYHYVARRSSRMLPAWVLRRRGARLVSG